MAISKDEVKYIAQLAKLFSLYCKLYYNSCSFMSLPVCMLINSSR